MKYLLAACLLLVSSFCCATPSQDEAQALREFHDTLWLVSESDPRLLQLNADFRELVKATGVTLPLKLEVTSTPLIGHSFPGGVIVVQVDLASLPRAQRMLVLGHELGHQVLGHFASAFAFLDNNSQLFTNQAAEDNPAWRTFLHQQEYDADAYAVHCLHLLGLPLADAVPIFEVYADADESLTHPATKARIARMRQLN